MQITYYWPAVALCTLLGVVIHTIWFSPLVLGGLWQRLTGLSDEDARQGLLPRLGLALLSAFATSLCLAGFFNFTGSSTFMMGAMAGLQFFLGLVVPAIALVHVMARRPLLLLALDLGPVLLNALVLGGLLAAWRS